MATAAPSASATSAGGPAQANVPALEVVFCGDFHPGSLVKVCGSLPELGAWKADAAPQLSRDGATGRFTGRIPLGASLPSSPSLPRSVSFSYKILVAEPAASSTAPPPSSSSSSSSSSPPAQAAGEGHTQGQATPAAPGYGAWQWQPGSDRRRTFTVSPSLPLPAVHESWFHRVDGTAVLRSDPWLDPQRDALRHRYGVFAHALAEVEAAGEGLDKFSRGYELMGFTRGFGPASGNGGGGGGSSSSSASPAPPGGEATSSSSSSSSASAAAASSPALVPGIWYREWAPAARDAYLMGDFNSWNDSSHKMTKDEFGVFSLFLPDIQAEGGQKEAIPHDSYLKLSLVLPDGTRAMRVPAWIRYAVYDRKLNEYVGKYWNPPPSERHEWKHLRPRTVAVEDYTRPGSVVAADGAAAAAASTAAGGGATAAASPAPGFCEIPSRSNWLGRIRPSPEEESALPAAYRSGGGTTAASSSFAAAGGAVAPTSADPVSSGLRIYEAHVGMASAEEKVASYREFARDVLPRIKSLGYNCVQLMAIMEHSYYGSFGYHVNQFVAPSSRFGSPEDLKFLVDAAHGMGLLVIMDCVHSHANKNVNDGLNMFDGTDHQYFHSGARGNHDLWDSRLFDYSKLETRRLLLSSLRLFVEEFRFDGFRFDGVTSMMYLHHGLSYGFSGDYREYFGDQTDLDAVVYLMLANHLLHTLETPALSIAEDVSGMPTLCRPVWEGGVGFDYRLGMAIPDKWIQFLKEKSDDEWDVEQLAWVLTNRRWQEKTIAYAESHDQALVGDKTLAFWLMDKEMYFHMSTIESPRHPLIDRGLALHKMIRLLTYGLGGEGYLNFMGNEFGHPEWIDFPREGNGWSYKHCRRQWNLVDDDLLYYKPLNNFDRGMHHLEEAYPWLLSRDTFVSTKNQSDKVLAFDRGTRNGPLVFVFNFHPTQSFTDYKIGVPCEGEWEIALDSDSKHFAGYDRVDPKTVFRAEKGDGHNGRPSSVRVYTPSRTALVLRLRK